MQTRSRFHRELHSKGKESLPLGSCPLVSVQNSEFRKKPILSLNAIGYQLIVLSLAFLFTTLAGFWQTPPVLAQSLIPISPMPIASFFHFSGKPPSNLGVQEGKLSPCPSSPNCVSSQSPDAAHQIDPFIYNSDAAEGFSRLKNTLENLERANIITADGNYIYAEFSSNLMGFVDDVEFFLDEATGTVQVRSASRLGESDLGVNRKRIETIRTLQEDSKQ